MRNSNSLGRSGRARGIDNEAPMSELARVVAFLTTPAASPKPIKEPPEPTPPVRDPDVIPEDEPLPPPSPCYPPPTPPVAP
jgi:hypothetical protein